MVQNKILTGLAFASLALAPVANCLAYSTDLHQQTGSEPISVRPLINTVGTPLVEDSKSGRLYEDDRVRKLVSSAPTPHATNCLVDFTDQQAISYSEASLYFDRIYVPWFQECSPLRFVDIRPTYWSHVHLSFEDEHVLPCFSNDMGYPSRIEDNECQFVDVPTEPRTYITTHNSGEHLLVRLDDSDKYIPFNFHQLKIVGSNTVQLCFKKSFSNEEPWEAQSPSSGPADGPWLCWTNLTAGYWNIENWAQDVIAVRLSPTGGAGSFSIDDIEISY